MSHTSRLSDPYAFCPIRVCQGMECRELVTQVIEEANWSGWGNSEIRNCRELLPFLGWKDGGRSWITLWKLEPPWAYTLLQRGRKEGELPPTTTTSSPASASHWSNPAWGPPSREPANVHAIPTEQAEGKSSPEADRPRSVPWRLF